MPGDQRLELRYELGVTSARELCVHEVRLRGQPGLLEPSRFALGERLVVEVGERVSAPQCQCLPQQFGIARGAPAPCEQLEALEVELPRLDPQQVTRWSGQQPVLAECF